MLSAVSICSILWVPFVVIVVVSYTLQKSIDYLVGDFFSLLSLTHLKETKPESRGKENEKKIIR